MLAEGLWTLQFVVCIPAIRLLHSGPEISECEFRAADCLFDFPEVVKTRDRFQSVWSLILFRECFEHEPDIAPPCLPGNRERACCRQSRLLRAQYRKNRIKCRDAKVLPEVDENEIDDRVQFTNGYSRVALNSRPTACPRAGACRPRYRSRGSCVFRHRCVWHSPAGQIPIGIHRVFRLPREEDKTRID